MDWLLERLNHIAAIWADLVVAVLWQSTLVALAVALLAAALRRSSPAVRYWLWQLVAIKLLVMPLWTWSLPATLWSFEHIGAPQNATAPFKSQRTADIPTPGSFVADEATEPADPPLAPRTIGAPLSKVSWRGWLFVGWAAIVVLQIAQLLRQRARLARLLRQTKPAGPELVQMVRSLAETLGVKQPPRVQLIAGECSPFVYGVFRPVLVLPQDLLAELQPTELRQVIAHELAHIKRRDLLWGWTAQVARMIYFFHPVAYWAQYQIRLERELACDQVALSMGDSGAAGYAQTLVRVVDLASRPSSLRTCAAAAGLEGNVMLSDVRVAAETLQQESRRVEP